MDGKFKLIIAGSRTFWDYDYLVLVANHNLKNITTPIEIVSGTAQGADILGERYAKSQRLPIKQFPADWVKFGRKAGYIRNRQMAEYADALLCFWNCTSRGTRSMIQLGFEYGLKVKVYDTKLKIAIDTQDKKYGIHG